MTADPLGRDEHHGHASEEQLRRGQAWADRRLRRAYGPRTQRMWDDDTEAAEARDEATQIQKGGNR